MRTSGVTRLLAILAVSIVLALAAIVILPAQPSIGACAAGPGTAQRSVTIEQNPMRPLLVWGDVVAVSSIARNDVRRGDVVAFDSSGWPTGPAAFPYVMRVVAVGGDGVEMLAGRVLVNGVELAEPYVYLGGATLPVGGGGSQWRVPADDVFVLGDNRSVAADSRLFGPLPVASIIGRVTARCGPSERSGPIT